MSLFLQIHERNLSNHKVVCENGVNPYPVYSAIEKEEGDCAKYKLLVKNKSSKDLKTELS